jgi:dTDP-4-amino-4,6-dideoxygalactose transaminase
MHIQPVHVDQFRGQSFPVAEDLCRSGLYLPTSEALSEQDVEWICENVCNIQRINSRSHNVNSSS